MDGGSIAILGMKLPSQGVLVTGLSEAARSTPAFAAYLLLALCWTLLLARGQSLRGFSSAIEDLPELQRAQILKRSYPGFAGKNISSHAFIRSRQKQTWLFALIALLVVACVVTTVAAQSIDWQAARWA